MTHDPRRSPRAPRRRRSNHAAASAMLFLFYYAGFAEVLPEIPAQDPAQDPQTSSEVKPLLCPGFSDLPSEFWDNLSQWQDRYGRDSTKMAAYFYELFVNRIDVDSLVLSIGDSGQPIDFYKDKESEWWGVSSSDSASASDGTSVLTSWLEEAESGSPHEKKLAFYGGISDPAQGVYEFWKQLLVNESWKRGFKEKWVERLLASNESSSEKEGSGKDTSEQSKSKKSSSPASELLRAIMGNVFPSEETTAGSSALKFDTLLPSLTSLTSAVADAIGGAVLDDQALQKVLVGRRKTSSDSKSNSPTFPSPPRRKVLDEGLALCPTVVLEVMMNAVLHIDLNFGVHAARNWLLRIYRYRRRALAIIDKVIAEDSSSSVEVDAAGDAHAEHSDSGKCTSCSPEAAAARARIAELARVNRAKLEAQRKEWYDDIAYVYPKMLGLGRLGAMREAESSNVDGGGDGSGGPSGSANHGDESEDGISVLLAGNGDDEDDGDGTAAATATNADAEQANRKIELILDSFKPNDKLVTKDFLSAKRSAVVGQRSGGTGLSYLTADRFVKATEHNSGEERVPKVIGMKELLKTVRLFRVREIFKLLAEWEKSQTKKSNQTPSVVRKARDALAQATADVKELENELRRFNEIIRANCDLDDPGSACFEAFDEGGSLRDSADGNNPLLQNLEDLLKPLVDLAEDTSDDNSNQLSITTTPSSSTPFSSTSAVTALTPKNLNKDDCAGQKVFVYGDLDPTFYTPSLLRCLQGQWGTEVIMRAFLDTNCRTQNPEEADWFYVTLYGTCRYVALEEMQNIDVTELQKANETGQAPARIDAEAGKSEGPLGSTKNSRVAVAEREKKEGDSDNHDSEDDSKKDDSTSNSKTQANLAKDRIKNSPIGNSNHFELDWSVDKITNERIFDPLLLDHIRKSKWYHRRQGRDHIFLFADGQGPRIWDSYDMFRGASIFMSPEATCPTWREPIREYVDVKECLSSWKDIIIPGHTDYARIQYMKKFDKPTETRRLLLTFHGRYPGLHEAYEHCTVRGDIMKIGENHGINEGVDVGGFVSDYLERKGDSHFCLVPAGTSPWTNHLYESLYSGCIPVILSDEYVPAFREELPWQDFSIKWPESEVGEKLYQFLLHLVEKDPNAVMRLKYWGRHHACWFNWYSTDPTCSPFLLIMRRLRQLKKSRRAAPRFWNHEMSLDEGFDAEVRGMTGEKEKKSNDSKSEGYTSDVQVKGAYNAEKRREVAKQRQVDDLPKFGEDAAYFAQLRRRTRFKSKDDETSKFVYLYSETKFKNDES